MTERLPTISVREMLRVLKRLGFTQRRQKGSHAFLSHPDGRRTVVPVHPGDLSRHVFREILNQIEVSEDEIKDLL